MGYNPSKMTWFNPDIEYVFNVDIIEYDIRDAGFSIIKEYRLLPEYKIQELERMGKGIERHIAVGKLQGANKEFSKALSDKFAEVRGMFIDANDVVDSDIISVKKDAFFIIGTRKNLNFGCIEFAAKNRYTSYIRFAGADNAEIYYADSQVDIKQIGESGVNKHRLYMVEFISDMIRLIESKNPRAKRVLMNFIMKYKAGELDEEYYVKFDRLSREIDPLFNYQNIILPLVTIVRREVQ